MLFKILVIVLLVTIVSSLATGLFHLVRDNGQSERVVKSLSVRIGISVGLFILLLIAASMGWITPHPL